MAWRSLSYDPAVLRRDPKTPGFVYFRSWYDPACTRFEDQVLLQPAVLSATKPFHCIALDFASDEKLAASWGLTQAPAYAIVTPGGTVLARGQGAITATELISALNDARKRFNDETATLPATASAPAAP